MTTAHNYAGAVSPNLRVFKVPQYTFFWTIPSIFNWHFTKLSLTDWCGNYTSFWKKIEVWLNVFLKVIDISRETINQIYWFRIYCKNIKNHAFCLMKLNGLKEGHVVGLFFLEIVFKPAKRSQICYGPTSGQKQAKFSDSLTVFPNGGPPGARERSNKIM